MVTQTSIVDPITADLTVLTRARAVMQRLLLPCVVDPLDPVALQAAYDYQRMLTEDLAGVKERLQKALAS